MSPHSFASARRMVWLVISASGAASGCSHTLAFSDTSALVVIGHPPPPPPPPAPPPEPPAAPPAPAEPKRVEIKQDQIVIHDKIQFETNKAAIKPESTGLMDEIASVVQSNTQIKRLSIEGHTDSTGGDKRNQQLSEQRAAAVRDYLVQHGVAAERVISKGWGKTKPIADNATEPGREQNRRVEFIILEQDVVERTYEIDPATGQRRDVSAPTTPPAEPHFSSEAPAPGGAK
jgi:outer membrane protein OmpA-like peptidoglycan-associated protein